MGVARSLQRLSEVKGDRWDPGGPRSGHRPRQARLLPGGLRRAPELRLPALHDGCRAVAREGLPSSFASAPFALYYLVFALALVPAGRLERRLDAKTLMVAGLNRRRRRLAMLTFSQDFWVAVAARTLSASARACCSSRAVPTCWPIPRPRTARRRRAIVFRLPGRHDRRHGDRFAARLYIGPKASSTLASSIAVLTASTASCSCPSRSRAPRACRRCMRPGAR